MITLPTAAARIHALLAFHAPEEGLALRFHRHGASHSVGGALHPEGRLTHAILRAARDAANASGLQRILLGPAGWIAVGADGETSVGRPRGGRGILIDRLEAPPGTREMLQAMAPAMRGRRQPVRFHVAETALSAHERLDRAAVLARLPGGDADWLEEEMSMPWTAHPLRDGIAILSTPVLSHPVPVGLARL